MDALIPTSTTLSPTTRNLGELYSDYLRALGAQKKSKRTIDSYQKAMRKFFLFCSDRGETRPTEGTVLDYLNQLDGEGKSASTLALYLTSIKTFFRFLAKRKLYDNIAEYIDAPETDRQSHSKGFLSEEEEVRLLSVVEDSPRDYALVFLMLTTGLRTTEIVNADLEDLQEVGGELRLYVLGKGRKTKKDFVKISRDASRFLEEYVGDRTSGPIFLSESNRNEPGRLTTRSVSRIIKDALKESGIDSPSITAHSLRHTVAVQNLLSGGTLEETRELLRHRDARTTEIYSHDIERMRNKSEERLSSRLMGRINEDRKVLRVA